MIQDLYFHVNRHQVYGDCLVGLLLGLVVTAIFLAILWRAP